jgi:hypothetical protein
MSKRNISFAFIVNLDENKISDGWPAAAGKLCDARLGIEDGISWKVRS